MLNEAHIPAVADPEDLTLGDLLAFADRHPDLPLIFHLGDRPVKPGYHVTEVKAGRMAALDCGANPEAWTEIFIQIWDADGRSQSHMKAGKFAAIIRKVSDHVGLPPGSRLTFEVSDGVEAMRLLRAGLPTAHDGRLSVALTPRAASCKPRDRWLAAQPAAPSPDPARAGSCCG
jgi:hypothetical protein